MIFRFVVFETGQEFTEAIAAVFNKAMLKATIAIFLFMFFVFISVSTAFFFGYVPVLIK